jgi:hypothetical protein
MPKVYTGLVAVMLFLSCTTEKEIGVPALVYPINGEEVAIPLTFVWTSAENSMGYRIEVDTEISFTSPLILTYVGDTTYTTAALDTGMYYWHVLAFDEDNQEGEFAYPHSFTVIDTSSLPITAITGTLSLQVGVSGDLNNSRVAIYLSYDDWLNDRVLKSTTATGPGTTATYTIDGVVPGNYYLDAWKDVDNSGTWSSGDLWGVYGTTQWPNPMLTPFSVAAGQTFNANVTMIILP